MSSCPPSEHCPYILGLDLGSASVGWALVRLDKKSEPTDLLRAGVRVFDPGVDAGSVDQILSGKDESKAAKRRQMRLQRRQLRRRAGRQRDLFELLQRSGLLPTYPRAIAAERPHLGNISRSQLRHEILQELDNELRAKWEPAMEKAGLAGALHVLPYFLRARALDERLQLFELGRALYHLGQRRGFLSNRREKAKSADEEREKGKVYEGIGELEQEMSKAAARTLGEYFSRTDPTARRIRQRYTRRSMFQQEFESIWNAQTHHHAQILTSSLKKEMLKLLFWQRPIAAQSHLIGECELERGHKRAPLACLAAQRFRLLQKVNDLRICSADDYKGRKLLTEEREKLAQELETRGDLTFAQVWQVLDLPRGSAWFNFSRDGKDNKEKILGNRSNCKMLKAFGGRWQRLSEVEREEIVEAWRNAESEDHLARQAVKRWGLSQEEAQPWASEKNGPEDGYSRLSRKALGKLLPLMEQGVSFKDAEKRIYGVNFSGGKVWDLLPPVREALPAMRNPAVERAMTELRKVVNAIVREFGKPEAIRIELARELKNPRQARERIWKAMTARRDLREQQKEKLLKETGIARPSRDDIERMLLWDECGGVCPYTGRKINRADLFGDHPQFDVEHILPLKLCPDNSFANKTLCSVEENRLVKRGRTPWQAYQDNTERWEQILERVRRFKKLAGPPSARLPRKKKAGGRENGAAISGKLARFLVKSDEDLAEFSNRQMQDTRYTSKLAGRYLGLLYGGRDERHENGGSSSQRVFNTPGALTADLRRNWCLEAILRDAEPAASEEKAAKPRGDHRHHAIDAIVVALTTPSAVKAMSDAAERNAERGRTSIKGLKSPWPDFVESIRPHIESLVVSHRPEHKLSGPLHDETLYGNSRERNGKPWVHVRKAVDSLKAGDIENIVDPRAREAVEKRLKELGSLKALQTVGVDPPYLKTNDGRSIPIRRVRIGKALTTAQVGAGIRARQVAPNNNHHMEIVAELDSAGREIRWNGLPVSRLEALERRRKGDAVVKREHGPEGEERFKFSLMNADTLEVNGERQGLYVVRSVWAEGRLTLVRLHDARKMTDIRAAKQVWFPTVDTLRELRCRKVAVDVQGKVHPAND